MPPPPSADGLYVEAKGLDEARERLAAIERRLRDMSPALKVVAAEVELRTDNALARSQSQVGDNWPRLALSTLRGRAARIRGGNARSKKTGKLTKGARKKRSTFVKQAAYHDAFLRGMGSAPAKPLIDTGRLRNSQRARVVGQSIEWSAVGYMAPHITGAANGRPPKRNPTCFELRNGEWFLNASMAEYMAQKVRNYVMTGKP